MLTIYLGYNMYNKEQIMDQNIGIAIWRPFGAQ